MVTMRDPLWLVQGLFEPVIYLVLFAPLLNGVAHAPGFPSRNAIQFFAPGLLIMNAMFGSGFEGFTLRDKILSGFLERLRVTPVSRLSLALGFIFESSFTLIVQSTILILCSLVFGLRLQPLGALAVLVLVVLIGITMAAVSYCLGLVIRQGGVLAGVINTYALPLLILSGVMLPVSFGPPLIQMLARFDPFYYAVEASRALINGPWSDPAIPAAYGIFGVLAVAALGLFIHAIREAVA